jgi:arylsulfatase A-like enzyme
MKTAEKLDGRSLAALWNGVKEPERVAYTESFSPRLNFGWSELRALRTATMKVIDAPSQEIYDLRSDPQELHNLQGQDTAGARPLFNELATIKASDPFTHGQQKESPAGTHRRILLCGRVQPGQGSGSQSTRNDAGR